MWLKSLIERTHFMSRIKLVDFLSSSIALFYWHLSSPRPTSIPLSLHQHFIPYRKSLRAIMSSAEDSKEGSSLQTPGRPIPSNAVERARNPLVHYIMLPIARNIFKSVNTTSYPRRIAGNGCQVLVLGLGRACSVSPKLQRFELRCGL